MTARPYLPLRSRATARRAPTRPGEGTPTPLLLRWARKGGIAVGLAMLAGGVAMLVLPGPGLAVIVLGLAVLATEYDWAARLLARPTARPDREPARRPAGRRRQAPATG